MLHTLLALSLLAGSELYAENELYPDLIDYVGGGGVSSGLFGMQICTMDADDVTPGVGVGYGPLGLGCNIVITSDSNTGATAITTFDGVPAAVPGTPGSILYIVGPATAAFPTTIADAANFELEIAWSAPLSGSETRVLILECIAADTFVEVGRHNGDRYFDAKIFVEAGNATDFTNAQAVVGHSDTGETANADRVGLVGEGAADGTNQGRGLAGFGQTSSAQDGTGVYGSALVAATGNTSTAWGGFFTSAATHAGGANVGVYCNASGSGTANYCLRMQAGDISSLAAVDWDVLDNTDDTLCIESAGDAGTLCIDSRDAADGVHMAGYLTVDGLTTLSGGLVLGGDLDFAGNDAKNLDDLYGDAVATDAAPRVTVLGTQPIFVEPAAANVTGADLVLAPSPGERTLDGVTLAATTGDTLTFDVYSNGVVSQTVKTEGVDWDCDGAGTDIICVCNLYDDLVANPITGVVVTRTDATCSDEKLTFTIDPGVSEYLKVTTSDDTNLDMTAGADGQVLIPSSYTAAAPGIAFAAEPTTGIFQGGSGRMDFSVGGTRRLRLLGATSAQFAVPVEVPAAGYISFSGLTELRAPADNQLQICNAAETQCFTLGASAADTATLWDKAGTGDATLESRTFQGSTSSSVTLRTAARNDGSSTASVSIASGNQGAVGALNSGNINTSTGTTNTAGGTGDILHQTGASGDGTGAAAGDHLFNTNGANTRLKIRGPDGDVLLHLPATTDAAPLDGVIIGANAYAQASAGAARDGADVHVATGIRAQSIVCDNWAWAALDEVVFTVNGVAQAALVEGTDWDDSGASNDAVCISLAAAIVTAAYGITPDAVTTAGTIYLTPDEDLLSLDSIVITDGGVDGDFGQVIDTGSDGAVVLHAKYNALRVADDGSGNTFVQFGGTTAAYPALRRSAAGIDFRTANNAGYANATANTLTASANVLVGAAGYIAFVGRTKWASSADGIWEMGINAGTQGVRMDTATLDGTLALYDEADGALIVGANSFLNSTIGATATFGSVSTTTAAASGSADFGSGFVDNAADIASGNVSLTSGYTTTDGLTGSVTVGSGAAGAGQADAGSLYLQVHGQTWAGIDGPTGTFFLDDPGASVNSPALSLRGDDTGTEVEGTIELAFGAQPYLFFSVDDDSATPALTAVLHLDDSSIRPASDGLLDLGSASNSFTDAHIDNDVLLLDGAVVGITGNEVITFNAAGTIAVSGADMTFTGSHAYRGQKYITAAGVVDINTGGQGVTVKVDAAGITWSSANLDGMALTTESLVVTNAGDYLVNWHISWDGTNGKRYLWEIITDTNNDPSDGSPVSHDQCHVDASVEANTHGAASAGCIITVGAGEYVYLAVTEPGGGAGTNITVDHGGVTLTQQ